MNLVDSNFFTTNPWAILAGLCSPVGMLLAAQAVGFARNHNKDWLLDNIAHQFGVE